MTTAGRLTEQSQKDIRSGERHQRAANGRSLTSAVENINIWARWLILRQRVARMLDDVASVPGTGSVLLTFDDFSFPASMPLASAFSR